MSEAGYARVRACFEKAEEIFLADDPRNNETLKLAKSISDLPQMPQLPQRSPRAYNPISLREDIFEERAAFMEYDGGLPRPLAEFLAGKRREEL